MSSPNSCITTINRANTQTSNADSALLHQPGTVYVGKEQYPLNLTPLEDVLNPTWKKQRGFDQLETAVLYLWNTHQVADLMELVRQEISIDVDSTVQDTTR